jgi:hypothetical protein
MEKKEIQLNEIITNKINSLRSVYENKSDSRSNSQKLFGLSHLNSNVGNKISLYQSQLKECIDNLN